jgi:hypothetical protein
MDLVTHMSAPTATVYARGPVVDLQLAQTYVPGLYCLLRCTIVILFMTRSNVMEDMSILMVMSIVIYIDRSVRNESIFDSNAVTMSILLSHIFNLLRVREVVVETAFVIVYTDNTTGLTKLGAAVQGIYCVTSAFLIADYNVGPIFAVKAAPDKKDFIFPLLLHGLLMATIVFIHINPTSMNQIQTNSRSFAFVCLSILWSYVVGVKNTVNALHKQEYCKVCFSPLQLLPRGPP